jgi:hypothetical protein
VGVAEAFDFGGEGLGEEFLYPGLLSVTVKKHLNMSVVILKWNPGFSSYTMARFLNDLEKCALANNDNTDMNWSVWDYEQVHEDDIFYLLKVGYGQTGIVARETLVSEPYQGEDWSWRNRPTNQ